MDVRRSGSHTPRDPPHARHRQRQLATATTPTETVSSSSISSSTGTAAGSREGRDISDTMESASPQKQEPSRQEASGSAAATSEPGYLIILKTAPRAATASAPLPPRAATAAPAPLPPVPENWGEKMSRGSNLGRNKRTIIVPSDRPVLDGIGGYGSRRKRKEPTSGKEPTKKTKSVAVQVPHPTRGRRKTNSFAAQTTNLAEEDLWDKYFYHFMLFRARNGSDAVPSKDNDGPIGEGNEITEKDLSKWVATQRKERKILLEGKDPCGITSERLAVLNSVSFPWGGTKWDERRAANFKDNFKDLLEFRGKHGHCDVPASRKGIGPWVVGLRKLYKRSSPKLTSEMVTRLEEIGFNWTVKDPDAHWNNKFELLTAYVEARGHCKVPRKHKTLGRWVYGQRDEMKKRNLGSVSKLTDERLSKLDSVGFIWNVQEWKSNKKAQEKREREANEGLSAPGGQWQPNWETM
ncbi:hypothetical protein ACHAWF_011535 [Thalassiosira exigua]